MCVKLSPGDLNPSPCPTHLTSTYICGVTIAPTSYTLVDCTKQLSQIKDLGKLHNSSIF